MAHPFTTSIVYEKPEDAERQYRPNEVRKLNIGDRVIFNSIEMEDRYATYDGIVVAVQDTYITLSIRIRPETAIAGVLDTPRPYNYAVEYFEIGRTSYIWKPKNLIAIDFDIKGDDGSKSNKGIHLHYLYSGDYKPLKEARNEY